MKTLLVTLTLLLITSVAHAEIMTCLNEQDDHFYRVEFEFKGKRLVADGARFRVENIIVMQEGLLVLGVVNSDLHYSADFGERTVTYHAPGAGAALRRDNCLEGGR